MEKKYISENIRFLLWQSNIDKENWTNTLGKWAQCSLERARSLLEQEDITPKEQQRICEMANIDEQCFACGRLVSNILQQNVRFLIDNLRHGEKRELAQKIGVHATTISRWLTAKQKPQSKTFPRICDYFGLPANTDLREEPLFLLPYPTSDIERREWLRRQIDRLDSRTLQELYPALKLLLEVK